MLISAPMGPIGMLVIQRALSKGRWAGMFTGVGAAISDLIYCLLTGFGLSFITDFIDRQQQPLQMVGGMVIVIFGLYLFHKNPAGGLKAAEDKTANNYWTDFVTGFLLTFSNPLILFFTVGLFTRFSFIMPDYGIYHYLAAFAMIFIGAILWWFIVTYLVNKLRRRFNVRSLWLVNRIVGSVLIGMGAVGISLALKNMIWP